MQKITPFLWFDHQAEEAVDFYTSVFKDSKKGKVARYGAGAPAPEGSVMTVTFQIHGQDFIALNGGPLFTFSQAISFVVSCETQDEIDELWEGLSAGGEPQQCGWLRDKYGVSWQIVPVTLGEMMQDRDREKSNRVMQSLLQMNKIDMGKLEEAYKQR